MTPHPVLVNRQSLTGYIHALLSVAITEWRIRWRMNSWVTFVAVFAALAVLLTPGLEAPYAVITVRGNRLAMNADTMLIAAASLLALLLMPVQFLTLTLGVRRDIQWGLAPLHLAAPVPPAILNLGRMTARVFGLCADTLLILMLLSIAMLLQHHALPGAMALTMFPLILIPAGLAAFSVGIVIDGLFRNVSIRILIAFGTWCAVMLMTIFGGPDVIGYGLLSANLARNGGPAPISLGFSPVSRLGIAEWHSLLVPAGWFSGRAILLLACCAAACAVALLTRRPHIARGVVKHEHATVASSDIAALIPVQVNVQRTPVFRTTTLIARRLILRRGMSFGILAAIASLPALGAPTNLAPAAVLLLPIILFNGRTPDTSLASIMVLPALWRPTPNMMALIALISLMLPPLLPCLLISNTVQSVQMTLACLSVAAWFVFCNNILCRPQLCQAVHILTWYLFAVNTPPSGFDLIGHSTGSTAMVAILALVSLILLSMIATADWRQNR